MSERAGLFDTPKIDVTAFAPKKPAASADRPPLDDVRAVSEAASFRSREPLPAAAAKPGKASLRRRRTGRNAQLNIKLAPETLESFYKLSDRHGWGLGEAFEKALEALSRELGPEK
jgi:hypothetical protein